MYKKQNYIYLKLPSRSFGCIIQSIMKLTGQNYHGLPKTEMAVYVCDICVAAIIEEPKYIDVGEAILLLLLKKFTSCIMSQELFMNQMCI